MRRLKPFQGVIFDMDNTLLKSNIDFFKMKKATRDFLVDEGILEEHDDWEDKTASQIIERGRTDSRFASIESQVWRLVAEIEAEGMRDATLEPGALEIARQLKRAGKTIAILTNNAYFAAEEALRKLSIFDEFDLVIGREQMEALKPSPSGVFVILDRWKEIEPERWVLIGDSWIDGMAAQKAGISFISYQADSKELKDKGVETFAQIDRLDQLKPLLLE